LAPPGSAHDMIGNREHILLYNRKT
jgi:hypothetical protein